MPPLASSRGIGGAAVPAAPSPDDKTVECEHGRPSADDVRCPGRRPPWSGRRGPERRRLRGECGLQIAVETDQRRSANGERGRMPRPTVGSEERLEEAHHSSAPSVGTIRRPFGGGFQGRCTQVRRQENLQLGECAAQRCQLRSTGGTASQMGPDAALHRAREVSVEIAPELGLRRVTALRRRALFSLGLCVRNQLLDVHPASLRSVGCEGSERVSRSNSA